MKAKIFMLIILSFIAINFTFGFTQNTGKFKVVLRSVKGTVLTQRNVDLYQSGVKKYDLSESSSRPGEYYHNSVIYGIYDLYLDDTIYESSIAFSDVKKTIDIIDKFTVTGDSLTLSGKLTATTFSGTHTGDGSGLTGITASVLSAPDNLELPFDTNSDGVGYVIFKKDATTVATLKRTGAQNYVWFATGTENGGAPAALGNIQAQTGGTVSVAAISIQSSDALYVYMMHDDTNSKAIFGVTETGTFFDGLEPLVLQIGATEVLRFDETNHYMKLGGVETDADEFVHIETSKSEPLIKIETSNGTAAQYPGLYVYGSSQYTDGDGLSGWKSTGLNANSLSETTYAFMKNEISESSDPNEAGRTTLQVKVDGTLRDMITIDGKKSSTNGEAAIFLNKGNIDADVIIRNDAGSEVFSSDGQKESVKFLREQNLVANAWFPATVGVPGLTVLDGRYEVYAFDPATAETLSVAIYPPTGVINIDSAWVFTEANSVAGDSVAWKLDVEIFDENDLSNKAINDETVQDTLDLGTTAYIIKKSTVNFSSLTNVGGKEVFLVLTRNNTISDNESGDVYMRRVVVFMR